MEPGRSTTDIEQYFGDSISLGDEDSAVQQRLDALLSANAQIAHDKAMLRDARDVALMSCPIDSRKAFAYFGYMIGTMPPAAVAIKAIAAGVGTEASDALFLILLLTAAAVTGMAGYVTGKYVPGWIGRVSNFRLPNRVAMYSLIGMGWGAISGATGGLFLFVIGSIFGGIAGALIGAITVPILIVSYEALRRGEFIELKHFLPVAFGITLSLCAFILGF